MRSLSILMLGVCAAGLMFAQKADSDARGASVYTGPRVGVSMYIWSDKYTYSPNEALTLKWMVKPNNDLYPYTIFVYRQNNQTGAKTYYPNGTSTVTDINGKPLDQIVPAQLQAKTKATLLGAGGIAAAVPMPNELGMHTFVVELRDYTGTKPLKTAYMKVAVVSGTQTLSGDITSDKTLTNDTKWVISGIVAVKNNAVLTVQPGTIVYGATATSGSGSVLLITQNGRLDAAGTQARPIIFTSSRPFGQRQRGDWGGILILGKAPVNVAANINTGSTCGSSGCNNPAGSFYIEGLTTSPDGLYGGTDPTHNCGTFTYARIEYSGIQLSPANETNSWTFAGCGSKTTAHHLQAIYGGDDSFEWFGGTMNAKYLIGGLGADDFTDYQLGYTGKLQFGLMYQSPDQRGNRGIEADNSEYDPQALPRSNPTFYNITYIGSGQPGFDEPSNSSGLFFRRATDGTFNNLVVTNFYSPCFDIADTNTQARADAGSLKMDGILCWKNNLGDANAADTLSGNVVTASLTSTTYDLAYAQGQKGNGAGKNFVIADPLMQRPFEYSDPDFVSLFSSPVFRAGFVAAPDDGFFDQVRFIGGIGDVDWTQEWSSFLQDIDIQ